MAVVDDQVHPPLLVQWLFVIQGNLKIQGLSIVVIKTYLPKRWPLPNQEDAKLRLPNLSSRTLGFFSIYISQHAPCIFRNIEPLPLHLFAPATLQQYNGELSAILCCALNALS